MCQKYFKCVLDYFKKTIKLNKKKTYCIKYVSCKKWELYTNQREFCCKAITRCDAFNQFLIATRDDFMISDVSEEDVYCVK